MLKLNGLILLLTIFITSCGNAFNFSKIPITFNVPESRYYQFKAQFDEAEDAFKSKSGKDKENGPKPGMVLLNTETGAKDYMENIRSFSFSNDSRWILYSKHMKDAKDKTGTDLIMKSLLDSAAYTYSFVTKYALDSISSHLALVVADTNGMGNGVFVSDLTTQPGEFVSIYNDSSAWADNLTWNNREQSLAYLAGIPGEKEKREKAALFTWSPGQSDAEVVLEDQDLEEGWLVYHTNRLRWSKDGQRLFLGTKPETEIIPEVELIIGHQADVPKLNPEETQNRFNLVFKNFIKIFAGKDHPLVLFLDDLQWADLASLNLINVGLIGREIKNTTRHLA